MKKRIILFIVLALVLSISLSVSLSACKIAECEHEWEDSAVLVEATCTTAGSQEQKCTKCGTTQTIEIATLGHDLKPVFGKDATCTESGFSAYEQCSRCDYNTKGDDLPKLDHSFGDEWKSDDNGHWHECVRDNCTVKSDEGSHADDDHDHKCDDCGFVLPHVFGEWQEKVDATCIAEGRKAHKDCSICGKHFDADGKEIDIIITIDSNNHDFSESWSSDSSGHYHVCKREDCEAHDTLNDHADDNHDHKCDECTYIMSDCKSNAVPTVKKDETCTEDGYEAYWTCSVCGKKYSDANCATEIENIVVRPAHGHSFTAETVHADYLKSVANCLEKAVYYKSCVHCGLSSKGTDDEVTFSNGDVDASNHTGTLVWVSIDNEYHQQEYNCCHIKVGEKEEHNFVDGVCDDCKHGCKHTNNTHYDANPATCTEDGNIEYYHCNLCNKNFSDSDCTAEISGSVIIEALGHNIVLDTDQGNNGYTWTDDHSSCTAHGKCDRTGCTHTEDVNATLTPNKIEDATCIYPERSDIDYSFSVSWANDGRLDLIETNPALGHNTDGTIDHVNATCTGTGVVGGTYCTRCNDGKSAAEATIDALGHNGIKTEAKSATCTATGNIDYWTCSRCNKIFSEEACTNEITSAGTVIAIDPTAHNYGDWSSNDNGTHSRTCSHNSEHIETVNCSGGTATCTTQAICSVCSQPYGEYSAHNYGDWTNEVPATCIVTGIKGHKDCSVCGKHFDNNGNEIEDLTIAINSNGHNYVDNVCTYCDAKHPSIVFYLVGQINGEYCGVESDYENTGDYKFDNDGKVTVDFTIASSVLVKSGDNSGWYMADRNLGEDERSTVLYPSDMLGEDAKNLNIPANTKASFTIVINEDGTISISFTFDCLVHNLTEHKAKSETCTESGNIAYWTCSTCSNYFANAEGSAFIADANADGKITLDDTVIAIDPTAHNEDGSVAHKDATCTEEGVVGGTYCTRCNDGKESAEAIIPKLSHTFDQEKVEDKYLATEATCTENATYYKSCSCGLSSKDTESQATFEKADSALGHIDENKDHSCDRGCGESMGTHEGQLNSHDCAYCGNPASEHTGGTATCTEKAQCTICGEEYGNVLGHDVSKTTFARNEWKHWNECSRCGDKFNEAEHNYQETPDSYYEFNTSVCTGCNLVNDLGTEGLTYRYVAKSDSNPESYYIVTGYTGTATEVRIPYWGQSGEYMYKRVKYIDVNAFYSNSRITKVVLPSCLVEVGEKAFYNCSALAEVEMTSGNIRSYAFNKCTALTEINVPNTLEEGAFEGCTSLTTVKLFSGVYRIPNRAFIGCSSLSTIKYDYRNTIKEGLPSGIVSIGDYAFSGCSSLSNVDLPSDLDTLGIWAFQRTAIKSLTIPSRITEIPNMAFANCSELATINIHDNITKYGDSAFQDCALITTVPFSSKITHIGNHAFAGTAITSVHIPATVTKILGSAFSDCTSLTSLTFASGINLDTISGFIVDNTKVTTISIPDSVTQISDYAFWESKLTTINISTNSKLTYIGDSAFNKSTQLKSIYIPKGVTEIGWRAFNFCENLETITFATNSELVTIGEEAFFACYKLKSMVIPSGVTVIPKSAFVACREMTSITLPNNLTSIGEKAFEVCSMLDSISIPSGVKTIGDKAFSYCIELKSVTVPANTTLGNGVFGNCPKLQLTLTGKGDLVFQNGMLIDTATKTLQIVTYTGSRFVLPDDGSITTIGSYAFYGCENLVELVMSESIVSFGDDAFAECPNLKSVTFSSKITTITHGAFSHSGIESIVIPSTIETVGQYAFNHCKNLYSVTFEGVPTFGSGAFDGCYSLAELIELGGDIAYGSSHAKDHGAIVHKGDSKVTKDGDFAFITIDSDRYMIGYSGTDTDIVIPSGTTHIKNYAMAFNEEITSLVIPEGVVSIGVGSFRGMKSMTSVTLPISLKSIGAYSFNNCLSLESISLLDGLESIGEYAFQYCPFSNITIPSTVTSMGKGMLASNAYLESITLPLKNRLLYLFDISSIYIDKTKFYEAKENQSSSLGYYIPLSLKSITVTGSSGLSSYAFSGFTSIESIDVSNATAIYSYAFMDCTSLTEVVLPTDTITSIGEYAFKNCTSLSGITLPLNVGTIGQKLFEGCTSLDFVVFPRTIENALPRYPFGMVVNNLYYNGTMEDYVSLSFTAYNALSILANNVYLLQPNGTYAPLSGEVIIPEGVKSIGNYVFYGYQNITNIVIPEGVESIGVSAFEGCSLTSVVIPSTVTSIGAGVFGSNPYLESITVPFIGLCSGSVQDVQDGRCVHFFTTVLNLGVDSNQFYLFTLTTSLKYYVPLSLKSITVTGNNALKNYAFSGLKSVESIDVSNLPSISTGLFYNCSSLKTVKLPSVDFETIEDYAFYKCSSLESLVLPDSVKKIGRYAFYDCSSLKSVILPEGLKTINAYAFAGCTFTSIVVPSRVTEIGSGSFGSNPYLESLTVPFVGTSTTASSNSKKLIYFFQTSLNTGVDSSQFYIVTYKSTDYYIPLSLKSITFTGSVLGINAFDSLISLETVDISNVTYIDGAFANCTSLKSVTLSPSLKTISSDAFYNCTSLESLTLPEGLSTISSNAFAGCTFTSIVIPSSVKQFGNSAFENCTGLTEIEFKGTKAQWNAITKGTDWNKNVTATIICTDGTI